MRNLIHALRNEITSLTKKEIKDQISDLEKRLARIEQQERKRAKKPSPPELA